MPNNFIEIGDVGIATDIYDDCVAIGRELLASSDPMMESPTFPNFRLVRLEVELPERFVALAIVTLENESFYIAHRF